MTGWKPIPRLIHSLLVLLPFLVVVSGKNDTTRDETMEDFRRRSVDRFCFVIVLLVLVARGQVSANETAVREDQSPVPTKRSADGNGDVMVSGELKQWHKITLTLDGPFASERDSEPNPFTDFALTVTFTHESGSPKYVVPGYF